LLTIRPTLRNPFKLPPRKRITVPFDRRIRDGKLYSRRYLPVDSNKFPRKKNRIDVASFVTRERNRGHETHEQKLTVIARLSLTNQPYCRSYWRKQRRRVSINKISPVFFVRRSHLNDIRDRSVLRLFESTEGGPLPQGLTIAAPTWDQDQSYFSEPEFDSEYQHQHIHKTKVSGPWRFRF